MTAFFSNLRIGNGVFHYDVLGAGYETDLSSDIHASFNVSRSKLDPNTTRDILDIILHSQQTGEYFLRLGQLARQGKKT